MDKGETQRAKTEIPNETDISYGDAPRQKYDLYGTDLPEDSSIFLWIHGGYGKFHFGLTLQLSVSFSCLCVLTNN
ncbi:Kynurenine formamidase [Orchesella cincta]|uniref:Kynurenine formamidase n=1 Tax=Orchesella cincta TaxID=48709 RepID=A0A1D2MU06_ORCCI|nr:Kynurenine formamidase [Orchesella cincta]